LTHDKLLANLLRYLEWVTDHPKERMARTEVLSKFLEIVINPLREDRDKGSG